MTMDHSPIPPFTDRMRAAEAVLGMSVIDYIHEAQMADRIDDGTIATMLSEDSGVPVAPVTIQRWSTVTLRRALSTPGTFAHWWAHTPGFPTDPKERYR